MIRVNDSDTFWVAATRPRYPHHPALRHLQQALNPAPPEKELLDGQSGDIDGTYRDSCVVCLQGCDSAAIFSGTAVAHARFLMDCGMTQDEAIAAIQRAVAVVKPVPNCGDPGSGDLATASYAYRLCADCAATADASILLRAREIHGELPVYFNTP